jgi:hypothetical protein
MYLSPSTICLIKSRRIRWVENGEKRNEYKYYIGKAEGRRPLGRPRRRWVLKIDLGEIKLGGVDWICLAKDRGKWRFLMNAAMNLGVQQNAGKLSSGYTTAGFSTTARLLTVSYFS